MKIPFRFVFAAVFFLPCITVVSAAEPYKLDITVDRESAVYKKGETATFHFTLTQDGKPVSGKSLGFTVQGDGNYLQKGTLVSADSGNDIKASLSEPGFVRCTVGGEIDAQKVSAIAGAGFEPLEIQTNIPEPEDFDEFWNAKKAEIEQMPLEPNLVPVAQEKVRNPKVEVYDVKIACPGGMPVSGYFAKPVGASPKSLPIILSYHGAGVRSSGMPVGDAAKGALAFDVNAHGIENGQTATFYNELANGKLKDYRYLGRDNRDKLYFTGMYQRLIRSLQFMKSLPEWDGKTLVVRGGSQGGGQALVAAGIDSDVTFCVAHVPALCYPLGGLEGNFDGWPGFLRGKTQETADPAIVNAVPYVDAVNFAKRIRAESVLSVGFIDTTCSATSVYLAYNGIKGKKHILPTPNATHTVPAKSNETANRLMWEHIEQNRVK